MMLMMTTTMKLTQTSYSNNLTVRIMLHTITQNNKTGSRVYIRFRSKDQKLI